MTDFCEEEIITIINNECWLVDMNGECFFEHENLRIVCEDVLSTKRIKDESVDLIVTSPPYNVDIKYNTHNDTISYEEYLDFSHKWLSRCFKWLKDDGRMCLNVPLDINKGGQQSVGADLTTIARKEYYYAA